MKPPIEIAREPRHVAFRLHALYQRALEPALERLEATQDLSTNTWRVPHRLEPVLRQLYAQLPDTVGVDLHFADTVLARDARLEGLELLRYDPCSAEWAFAPHVRCLTRAPGPCFVASADHRDVFVRARTTLQADSVPYPIALALAESPAPGYSARIHPLAVPERDPRAAHRAGQRAPSAPPAHAVHP